MSNPSPSTTAPEPASSIAQLVEHAAHYLPEQAPLHTFVHHNTLHAFEHLPFATACVEAGRLFGTEPFLGEAAFARHLESGRIRTEDLDQVLRDDLRRRGPADDALIGGFTRRGYRELRLRNLFEVPRGTALAWQLEETDVLQRLHPHVDAARRRALESHAARLCGGLPQPARVPAMLRLLWEQLLDHAPSTTASGAAPARHHGDERRRDQLLLAGAADVDQRTRPLLIRLCAAYLDQGVASWPMPGREQGLLTAVRRLYGQRLPSPEPWSRGLAAELRRQQRLGLDPEATIRLALDGLGVPPERHARHLEATLLSLPGWAGMIRQFELRPDRAPVQARPAKLLDFVALELTFDLFAARHALRELLGEHATWTDLEAAIPRPEPTPDRELVYEAFVMAQIAEVDLEAFEQPHTSRRWLDEVRAFDELERRRLLQYAYERRLRITVLDGLAAHCSAPLPPAPRPRLQAIFCIDDRECSTRRHFEESFPEVQTFGYAGFFGVAMSWQGLGEVQPRPLCPVNLTPQHYVTERALAAEEEERWRAARRRLGLTQRALLQGSRQATRGTLLSTLLGLWQVVPMVARCLFPRFAERTLQKVTDAATEEPVTRLLLERSGDERNEQGLFIGYSAPEMADVVESALRTIGLQRDFCELVMVVGHGSSSVNNPHESAYDCGATGGGRGGPNARAFAAMANHPQVRALLRQRGLAVPDSTWFVGCYHNTCDDSMAWYDEDLMPVAHNEAFAEAKRAIETACSLDAHERCRRFASAPRTPDTELALHHAEGRAVDLAQPRPELGHATNAYAIVGRRSRTRGLFLDRRAFLISYDPSTDVDGAVLMRLLSAVVPVGAGINLEYYFSHVDPSGYGSGSKLPHNITGLIGVMDGHQSDLRTGLPWQMVEVHEPVRLLCVVEVEPTLLQRLLEQNAGMKTFVDNGWIQLVAWSPSTDQLWEYVDGGFQLYRPESKAL
ncbi:MAG: DUF2309 domain-containing protein [Planctomycetota bacterium]